MDWIFNHLQVVIVIAGVVAYLLNKHKTGTGELEDAPPREAKSFEDPELAERTRRIREEIQRKIEQRARGYAHEQPTLTRDEPPVVPPDVREVMVMRSPEPPQLSPAAASRQDAERMTEILAQQASWAEKLEQAREMTAVTQRRTQFETEVGSKEELAKVAVRTALGDDLRDPASLRRAFVLREILGPPVALRP
jgi:mannitol-1-phosphate/altronate dehydrogenase